MKILNSDKKIWRIIRRLLNLRDLKCTYWNDDAGNIFTFLPHFFSDKKKICYRGCWQNEAYFKIIEQDIRNDFTFILPLKDQNIELAAYILNTNSVSIHVRRGDYLQEPLLAGICEEEYYNKAIVCMNNLVLNAQYIVFSNDIHWCKQHLKFSNARYVDWNRGLDSYVDMQLMSLCKHNIIANSTFSWWGAWLNKNLSKKVIAPQKWVNNNQFDTSTITPADWIHI